MSVPPCRAIKSAAEVASTVDFIRSMLGRANVERCGKPATHVSVTGPRCEECARHEIEVALAGKSLLGLAIEGDVRRLGRDAMRSRLWRGYRPIQ
jgi:hypothetical protein